MGIQVTDAERVEDLKLIDTAMVEEVIQTAELKLISAKKFRVAIGELRGDAARLSPSAKDQQISGYPGQDVAVVAEVTPQEVIAICIDRSGSMGTPILAPDFAKKKVVNVATLDQGSLSVPSGGSAASIKRVMMELNQVASGNEKIWMHSGEGIHVFPSPDTLNFWRVLIEGPVGSPFEGGVFALNAIMPDEYPFKPPQITFETPIYHCNVSDSGKICLEILQDRWNPSLSVPKCLEAIRMMMKEPDPNDALRQWIAELTLAYKKSNGADTRYVEKAAECTQNDASMSIADWKAKWGC